MKTRKLIAAATLSLVAAAPVFAADAVHSWEGQDNWTQLNAPISQQARGIVGTDASFSVIEGRLAWPALNAPISTEKRGVVGDAAIKAATEGQTVWPQLERGLVRG